jgi:anthranilate phosphoribosyltransferase
MEHLPAGFPDVLSALLDRRDLPDTWATWTMTQIMSGEATPAQIAGFALALRAKGETSGEVAALAAVMLQHAVALDVPGPIVDIVGTGGDRAGTVNISTMAAIVCAAAGARVVKHGNRAASSSTGTADVLEALGLPLDLTPDQVAQCAQHAGIAFAFAPTFHPALRFAGPPRREIGVPTVFNILGPLVNPARPTAALIGCADRRLAPVIAGAALSAGQAALVVRGIDGLDEISPEALTEVWDTTRGVLQTEVVDPTDFGLTGVTVADLRGGLAAENAEILRRVLAGEREDRLGAIADTVCLNAAAALVADACARGEEQRGSLRDRVAAQLPRARGALTSGSAAAVLHRWIETARRV